MTSTTAGPPGSGPGEGGAVRAPAGDGRPPTDGPPAARVGRGPRRPPSVPHPPAGSRGPVAVLVGMVAVYSGLFGFLVYRQQSNFGTFGFDIGIHDQGIWLVSRGRSPFVTVRGLDYFAHHVNIISLAFVPFYWLGAGPHLLILVHTVAVACGAIPLWLLARDRLGRPWLALVPALAYLLHPAVQWITWWAYHPDSLAITPLLFAWWLAATRRWGWFWVAAAVALACKEDVALSVVMLGLLIALWLPAVAAPTPATAASPTPPIAASPTPPTASPVADHHRRIGFIVAGVGALWYVLATRVIIPWRNDGYGPFYDSFFPSLGRTIPEVLWNSVRHPSRVLHLARLPDRLEYYRQMFGPVAALPVFALPALLFGAPQFGVDITAQVVQGATIKSQYATLPVVAIFVATVEALGWLAHRRLHRILVPAAVAVLAASSLIATVQWGLSPLGRQFDSGVWVAHNAKAPELNRVLRLVPADAGVSVTWYLTPHMTHRPVVYEFPNPWVGTNYGRTAGDHGDPAGVDWLVVDRQTLGPADLALLDRLTGAGGPFTVVSENQSIVLARRSAPDPPSGPGSG